MSTPEVAADEQPAVLGAYESTWLTHNTPRSMVPAQMATVTISLTNTGNFSWTAAGPNPVRLGYHWRDPKGNVVLWEGIRTPLLSDTPPGGTAILDAAIQAPIADGAYELQWDLVHEGLSWFQAEGATPLVVPVLVLPPYGVIYEAHNTPMALAHGSATAVTIVLTNIGALMWEQAGANPVHLSYHWLDANRNLVVFNGVRSALSADVPPGGTISVNAVLQTPTRPGLHILQWDVVREGITWCSAQGVNPAEMSISIG